MDTSTHAASVKAPGCYASPSVFSHDSDICKGCPAFDDCSDACIETLTQLRSRINVESILMRHRAAKAASTAATAHTEPATPKTDYTKFLPSKKEPTQKVERKVREEPKLKPAPSVVDTAVLEGLPKKARELAVTWINKGLVEFVRTELQAGRNPFASRARQNHESVVCDELLAGAVTHATLKKAFMSKLGNKEPWSEGTASSHLNIALPAMVAFGIVEETSSGFVVIPASA